MTDPSRSPPSPYGLNRMLLDELHQRITQGLMGSLHASTGLHWVLRSEVTGTLFVGRGQRCEHARPVHGPASFAACTAWLNEHRRDDASDDPIAEDDATEGATS